MKIIYKKIKDIKNFIDTVRLRTEVFIIEQKCPPGWEPDELDKESTHYVATVDDKIVATARLREDQKQTGKIERMVVKKEFRGKGIGFGLTEYIIKQARRKGFKKLQIQAQQHAQEMYKKAGFKVSSKEYDLWNLGIPHIDMELII